ncbi:DUF4339 domain-containing protein [Kamptonema sp. UHCC 0994]|uniref:DUF4339 domain-containing protein n=1 Tax=Kamptonema sp. UHCC 0994 TaxID=3031329 RepID=UPI0023B98C22|nr:DUF4339 domain-containing protein [Kamptonema sp. UHCC 0994]MDF0553866.1 DUF4339 domain-containing protein [Kamptonema sp. UHCC 0994]
MNSKWPKGLPYLTSWLRAIALSASFFNIIHLFWRNIGTARDIEKLATFAWFCQIPLMAGYHFVAVQLAKHLERSPTDSQNTHPTGSWQHWKEGLGGFFVLFLALVVTGPITDAIAPISYSRSYYYRYAIDADKALFIYGLLSAIASAYLYYWKIPSRVKSLVVFCWPLIDSYLKTLLLLYIPLISSIPVLAAAAIISKSNLPRSLLALTVFLAIIIWFFATAAAFAAIHYYGAHWANWIANWWPESFPGYSYLQQKKTQRHNASVSKSFIHHETSWNLAAHDFTVLIYANILSSIASIPIYIAMSDELSAETLETLSAALYLIWTTIAVILWHSWGRSRAAKIMAASITKAKAKKAKTKKSKSKTTKVNPPKKPQPPADMIEVDLNQMSGEFGMTSMRPVRKKKNPDPEQTKWYVFRSGQAEGPYTREQLWLAQRITARSNVRRENETDWTRAGEIPELADFLTSKP